MVNTTGQDSETQIDAPIRPSSVNTQLYGSWSLHQKWACEDASLLSDLVMHVEKGGCDVGEFDLALVDVFQHAIVLFNLHSFL